MSKTATVRARIEPEIKAEAEAYLEELGFSPSEAIAIYYRAIIRERGMPISLRLPNKDTREAMESARAGATLTPFRGTAAILAEDDDPDEA